MCGMKTIFSGTRVYNVQCGRDSMIIWLWNELNIVAKQPNNDYIFTSLGMGDKSYFSLCVCVWRKPNGGKKNYKIRNKKKI